MFSRLAYLCVEAGMLKRTPFVGVVALTNKKLRKCVGTILRGTLIHVANSFI